MCVKIRIFLIFPHIKIKKISSPKKFLSKERFLLKKFLYKERFPLKNFLYKEISSLYENYVYFCNRKLLIKNFKNYENT